MHRDQWINVYGTKFQIDTPIGIRNQVMLMMTTNKNTKLNEVDTKTEVRTTGTTVGSGICSKIKKKEPTKLAEIELHGKKRQMIYKWI